MEHIELTYVNLILLFLDSEEGICPVNLLSAKFLERNALIFSYYYLKQIEKAMWQNCIVFIESHNSLRFGNVPKKSGMDPLKLLLCTSLEKPSPK